MKTNLTNYILAIILLSGCDHTKVEVTENSSDCNYPRALGEPEFRTTRAEYTNTSSSKYIEVTIKYTDKEGDTWTSTKKLKPGEIKEDCLYPKTKVSIVGEREIND